MPPRATDVVSNCRCPMSILSCISPVSERFRPTLSEAGGHSQVRVLTWATLTLDSTKSELFRNLARHRSSAVPRSTYSKMSWRPQATLDHQRRASRNMRDCYTPSGRASTCTHE